MPALFKGFFDRVFLPGWAFKYHDDDSRWDKLLKGKTADIIMTADAPNAWTSIAYHNSAIHTLKDAILRFCGVKTKKVMRVGSVKSLTPDQRAAWLDKANELGAKRAERL